MTRPTTFRSSSKVFTLGFACAMLGLVAGCSRNCRDHAAHGHPKQHSQTKAPLADLQPPSADRLEGVVIERLSAGAYTYMAVRAADGPVRWVVTMGPGDEPGRSVQITSFGERAEFHSKRLDRTFAPLVFGKVEASS